MFKSFAGGARSHTQNYFKICRRITHRTRRHLSCNSKGKDENVAAVLQKVNKLVIEPRPMPEIGPGDVIIAIDCVGICGSDVHYWKHGRIGPFVVEKPMIIGHEASGIIACCGEGVKNLKVGDRVAIEPGVPCRICEQCRSGRYNLCPKMRFCATPPYDGNLMKFYRHAADYCFKLPDQLTMEEGALLEPLSCGMAAVRRAKLRMGMNVLVLGSGPIGICTMFAARNLGANKIAIADINEERLKVAKELGADLTITTSKEEKPKCASARIIEEMKCMPDSTIDCVGSIPTAQLAMVVTKAGGTCTLVGLAGDEVPLSLIDALSREVDITGVFRYCNDYGKSLSLASSGKVCLKRLVTDHFDLKDTEKAFQTAFEQKKGTIKVMIHVQPRDTNNKVKFDM